MFVHETIPDRKSFLPELAVTKGIVEGGYWSTFLSLSI